jgi:hypothetical protein
MAKENERAEIIESSAIVSHLSKRGYSRPGSGSRISVRSSMVEFDRYGK